MTRTFRKGELNLTCVHVGHLKLDNLFHVDRLKTYEQSLALMTKLKFRDVTLIYRLNLSFTM